MDYINLNGDKCLCGKEHTLDIDEIIIENGAIKKLPDFIKKYNAKKAFILADINTFDAAGKAACNILEENEISYSEYVFDNAHLEPDEFSVGSAVMHFDKACDLVIAVGSGVINDIGKILANISNCTYIIVATAPSMDGYASSTSSMSLDGVKVSLPSKCADVIIGDINILKNAPLHMLKSGLGDMLAKYISICEWRIAHLLLDEYYCENVASLVRLALKRCTDNYKGLLSREDDAVKAVFEGLVIGGAAMSYAGLSRPASGIEHYFSHIWDMRGLEFNAPVELHGIQCAVATLISARLYEQIKKITPDREKALSYVKSFSYSDWCKALEEFLGKGAKAMTELEKKEQKYSIEKHAERLEKIIGKWDEILKIINEEIPSSEFIGNLLESIEAPKTITGIGLTEDILPISFAATKDIRDKYVLSRLAWDLGVIDELKFKEF